MTTDYEKAKFQFDLLTRIAENTRSKIDRDARPTLARISHSDLLDDRVQVNLVYEGRPWGPNSLCYFLRSTPPDQNDKFTLSAGLYVSERRLVSNHTPHVISSARAWSTALINAAFERRVVREVKSSWAGHDWMTGDGVFQPGSMYEYEIVFDSPSSMRKLNRSHATHDHLRFVIESVGFASGRSTERATPVSSGEVLVASRSPYRTTTGTPAHEQVSIPPESTRSGSGKRSLMGWWARLLNKFLRRGGSHWD